MERTKLAILFIIFLIALGFRLAPGSRAVIFPYDQARDALIAKHIVDKRDLPLLGPVSDIPGVHHGAVYYWLITPLYALNHYDPGLVVLAFSLFSSLGVFTYFWAGRRLFKEEVGWIAAILYAGSFLTAAYARWISNPPLVIPLMPLLIVWLYELITERKRALQAGVLLGLFVQLELVLGYLLLAVGLWALLRVRARAMLQLMMGFILGAAPLFLSEFRFGFQGLNGLLSYASQQSGQVLSSGAAIVSILDHSGLLVRDTVFGVTAPLALLITMGGVLVLISGWKIFTPRIRVSLTLVFSVWLSSLLLFCTGKSVTNFFLVGQEFTVILLTSFLLRFILQKHRAVLGLVLAFLVILQLRLFLSQSQAKRAYVQVQQGVLLSEREEVIRVIYEQAGGKPFTLSVFGTPYGVRTAWAYYLWLYQSQHGTVLPSWYGFAANGYLGDELLPRVDAPSAIHVVVYEPDFSVDPTTLENFRKFQDDHTVLVNEFEVNHHRLQIRRPR